MTEKTENKLKLRLYPDPILTDPTKEVKIDTIKTDEFQKTLDSMFELIEEYDGIGIAAPQIGRSESFFIVHTDEDEKFVFINPTITSTSNRMASSIEGCLSFPGITGTVERSIECTIEAINREGEKFTLDVEGLLACVIQHEYDHLEGKLFISTFSLVDRTMNKKKLKFLKQLHKMGGLDRLYGMGGLK